MAVVLRGGGAAPRPTTFADSFVRASGSVGTNWGSGNFSRTPIVNNVATGAPTIGNCIDAAQGLLISTFVNGAANCVLGFTMIPFAMMAALSGKTHFTQATFVGSLGVVNNSSCIIGVCMRGDEFTCYALENNANVANSLGLYRYSQVTATGLVTGLANLANNDVIRISADYSTAGQVTVTVKKNGATIATFVDNTANRLLVGCSGLGSFMASGSYQFRTFSCGLGL